ncbi:MAG: KamA family radical SAM protein [Coriobacteriia bacterium]|nr:KamA family radical SAM protein [Coriobacteriia bacterium]
MDTTLHTLKAYRGRATLARQPARVLIDVRALKHIGRADLQTLSEVTARFPFRASDYYLGLIDWTDPHDPIRRLIIPDPKELSDFGNPDASDEASNTPLPGLQHKYPDTALLLVTDQCAAFCRYCFRKRLFQTDNRETVRDMSAGIEYIRQHTTITDVLLTGGDALALPTPQLQTIIEALTQIRHVHTIRIGSKMLAYNPARPLSDTRLHSLIRKTIAAGKNVYLMCHFDHPREFTPLALEALSVFREIGVECLNQCPVTAGINDDATVLADLLQQCTDAGCPQYYFFQCRPTSGNTGFVIPITRAFSLIDEARARVSGLSRRVRYCLSHATGKVEVVGLDPERIYARYHRAKNPGDEGRMLVFQRDDMATWLDDLVPVI